MKKHMKFSNLIIASLLAVTPIAPLVSTVNLVQAASSVTAQEATKYFLSDVHVVVNGQRIPANVSLNNIRLSNQAGMDIVDSSTNLIDDNYILQAEVTMSGFTPTNKDRSFMLVDSHNNIVGAGSVSADSSISQGNISFNFNVKNGKIGSSSLGKIGTTTKHKSSKKKAKRSHKKSNKKRRRKTTRRKSHKKSRRSSRRRK